MGRLSFLKNYFGRASFWIAALLISPPSYAQAPASKPLTNPLTTSNPSSTPRRVGDPLPTFENNWENCGQGCQFQKGNEVLAVRTVTQTLHLKEVLAETDKKKAAGMLGNFCLHDKSIESDEQCVQRFKDMTVLEQMRTRAATIENNEVIMESKGIDKKAVTPTYQTGSDQEAAIQSLQGRIETGFIIPDATQLRAVFGQRFEKLGPGTAAAVQEWIDTYKDFKPRRDDFVKFRNDQTLDPYDPTSPRISVVDRRCGEQPCYDDAKYAAALNEFQARELRYKKVILPALQKDLKNITDREASYAKNPSARPTSSAEDRYGKVIDNAKNSLYKIGVDIQGYSGDPKKRAPSAAAGTVVEHNLGLGDGDLDAMEEADPNVRTQRASPSLVPYSNISRQPAAVRPGDSTPAPAGPR